MVAGKTLSMDFPAGMIFLWSSEGLFSTNVDKFFSTDYKDPSLPLPEVSKSLELSIFIVLQTLHYFVKMFEIL